MNALDGDKGRVAFAVGTGRCGTKFLARIIGLEPRVTSSHERGHLNEAFHRYCKWYALPVDDEGFLHAKGLEIREDLKEHEVSFEASAHLSLSIPELYEHFKAKFILLVRSPERVVNSYVRKGWYDRPIMRGDPSLALGYQQCHHFHHFLGRIVPSGEDFSRWQRMTRIGKLAWYWNALNEAVLEQFQRIPTTHSHIVKLEELSYHRYLEIAQFLGFEATISQQVYDEIARRRPNALSNVPTITTWTPSEIAQFEDEVAPMAERLGYEYRVDRLPLPDVGETDKERFSQRPKCKEGSPGSYALITRARREMAQFLSYLSHRIDVRT